MLQRSGSTGWKHAWASATLALLLAAVPAAAHAQQFAVTAGVVNLRAGPGSFYPIVNVIPGGLQVAVYGCLSDYSWCDVSTGPERGWIYANYLNYPYQDRYVPLATIGAVVGVTALVFILDDYWHDHYRHRRWYPERHRWARSGPRYAPPPPPSYRSRPPRALPPPPAGVRPPRPQAGPYYEGRPDHPRGAYGGPPGQARGRDSVGPSGQRGREAGPRGRGNNDGGAPGQRRRD